MSKQFETSNEFYADNTISFDYEWDSNEYGTELEGTETLLYQVKECDAHEFESEIDINLHNIRILQTDSEGEIHQERNKDILTRGYHLENEKALHLTIVALFNKCAQLEKENMKLTKELRDDYDKTEYINFKKKHERLIKSLSDLIERCK